MSGQRSLVIDIVADTICPWCFLGTRRLFRSLKQRPGAAFHLRHRSFLLNPQMPVDGMAREDYLTLKFGGLERAIRVQHAIEKLAQDVGVAFSFASIRRTPNSLASHRLIHFAARQNRAMELLDAIYHAYFVDGRDIGDLDTLLSIAEAEDLDRAETAAFLAGDGEADRVLEENAWAHRQGVTGVPTFIFDGRSAIAGAQEERIFGCLIDVAEQRLASVAPLAFSEGGDSTLSRPKLPG